MPRELRTIAQGVTYHCYSRCHDKQNLLLGSFGKQILIEAIQMCQKKYNFELNAVEIVANHIHLIIRTLENGETISLIMQYIKARVAEKYNKAMNRSGAFWLGRFGCKIVEESDDPRPYFFRLIWYIAYNPVRKGLSPNPRENPIGFINCYLIENYELPIKITLHPYFYDLGDTFEERVEKFLLYEDMYLRNLDT